MIALVATMAISANAQVSFGLRGGLNLTNLSLSGDLSDNVEKENQAGFYIGPTVKLSLPLGGFGVDASALYNQKNSKIGDETIKESEIAIPINLRFEIGLGQLANIFFKAGPQFAFPVGSKNIDLGDMAEYSLRSSNFSVNVGAGATLLKHLEVSANYNIACGKTGEGVWKNTKQAFIEGKPNTWQIGLAYYF